ncbi:MAG: LysR family transcriptional regulator [Acidobacteria bacterium]|nr:LysR family transcriptional regulator [Acidobacteriota bacterium]
MESPTWLNYHHLFYFWNVARHGGLGPASELLRLAPPTLSMQIHALEEALGAKLFERQGRRLALTEFGRMVYGHAEAIFSVGRELMAAVQGRPAGRPPRFVVGVNEFLPKIAVHRFLAPAMAVDEPPYLVCREDTPERLLAALVTHDLDLVLSDAPPPPTVRVKVFHQVLNDSPAGIFAAPRLAARLRRRFPRSLDGVPFLLPSEGAALRRPLEAWLDAQSLRPKLTGEFQDSSVMKAFGQAGLGVFPAPMSIADMIRRNYGVSLVGEVAELRERVVAISAERRFAHPSVAAIVRAAR